MRTDLARILLVAVLVTSPAAAQAVDARGALSELVDRVLTVLKDGALSSQQRVSRIEEIAYERFDWDRIGRLVLARNWKKLSKQQRADFTVELKRHLSLTYGRRIDDYSDEGVEIGDERTEPNGEVTVRTVIVGGASNGTRIDYRMRGQNGDWKVIDVIPEGVSLLSNLRSQVQEIISSKGADRLIEILRDRNEKAALPPTS